MNWRTYLQSNTRDPQFLGRIAIGILLVGVLAAFSTRWLPDSVTDSLIGARSDALRAHYQYLDQLSAAGDWWGVWTGIPEGMWLAILPAPTALAGLAGICWFVFLLHAGQPGTKDGIRWWLAALAVGLGLLSVWPTLFAIHYQEQRWNIHASGELIDGLRYFIAGVGLREELAKLLMFLPLVPMIIRSGSEREAMLVAACVGLGFAMEENIGYFTGSPNSTVDRFLLSNFLHMSLTGLAGLAVCRAIWWPKQFGTDLLAVLLLVVLLHGMFDAFLVLPALQDYSIGAFMIYILLAYRFFHELRSWWQPSGETISLTATFVVAVSLVTAATFVYFAAATNVSTAVIGIAAPFVSTGIFVYMFLREMPESLIR